jgi:hypothetical protein
MVRCLEQLSSNFSHLQLLRKTFNFLLSKDHLDQSHPHPKREYCDQVLNSVNELNQHKISECQKLTTNCVLKEFSCSEPVYLFIHSHSCM